MMFETSKHVPKTEKRCCVFKDKQKLPTMQSMIHCQKYRNGHKKKPFVSLMTSRLLNVMLPFFKAFLCEKSTKHYSSILLTFLRKINIFSKEDGNKNYFFTRK